LAQIPVQFEVYVAPLAVRRMEQGESHGLVESRLEDTLRIAKVSVK
jgi:hypothetical protein